MGGREREERKRVIDVGGEQEGSRGSWKLMR